MHDTYDNAFSLCLTTSSPQIEIVPSSIFIKLHIHFINVLFPAPFCPTKPTISPGFILKET